MPHTVHRAGETGERLVDRLDALEARGVRGQIGEPLAVETVGGANLELAERVECLAFWEENAALMTNYRRTLYGLVRRELEGAVDADVAD